MLANIVRAAVAHAGARAAEDALDLAQNTKTQPKIMGLNSRVLAGAYPGVLVGLTTMNAAVRLDCNGKVVEFPLRLIHPQ